MKNFRSLGNKYLTIQFSDGINLIVGENNVGKTSIFKALDIMLSRRGLSDNDYFKGNKLSDLTIESEFELSKKEQAEWGRTKVAIANRGGFGNRFLFSYSTKRPKGFAVMQDRKQGTQTTRIVYTDDAEKKLVNILNKKVKIFHEHRKTPSGENKRHLESYDESNLADVLSCLKNGQRPQRRKFELIKEKFAELFPNLEMEVTKEDP
jgi:predicted ATP-dependent endonuclease of OLD family